MIDHARRITKYPLFRAATVALYVFLYAPIFVFVLYAFNDSETVSVWGGLTTKWFRVAFKNEYLYSAATNTLIVAISATIIAVALAIPAALSTTSPGGNLKAATHFLALVSLPMILPEIVIGISLQSFFKFLKIDLGIFNVVIAHVVFCLPFAYLPIVARLRSMDTSILEAADDLYASRTARFWRIIFPLLSPGVISGAMLAFIVSFDNFIISFMVAGAGGTTLPVYIYGLVKTQITPELNAVSVVVMLVSLLLLMVAYVSSGGKLMNMGSDT